jgi:hypothetical protein
VMGDGSLIKIRAEIPFLVSHYFHQGSHLEWLFCDMRGVMKSDRDISMKPISLLQRMAELSSCASWLSRPSAAFHLSLNRQCSSESAGQLKIRRSRRFRGSRDQYQINPITDNQTQLIVSQGSLEVSRKLGPFRWSVETWIVAKALNALTTASRSAS